MSKLKGRKNTSQKKETGRIRRESNKEDRVLDGLLCYLYSKKLLN